MYYKIIKVAVFEIIILTIVVTLAYYQLNYMSDQFQNANKTVSYAKSEEEAFFQKTFCSSYINPLCWTSQWFF